MDKTHQVVADLPPSDSPSLILEHPTAAEKYAIWHLNSQEWRGPLSLPAYIRREEFMQNQPLTRDGGMTFWVLVYSSSIASADRQIVASCETYKKRALVARENGKVEEVVSHGIGSVFCDPLVRGKGYAIRMMKEIGKELYTWQQEDRRKVDFTVLYSDIGKKFYAKAGWQAYPSIHISLPKVAVENVNLLPDNLPASKSLLAEDLHVLCNIDEAQLRAKMKRTSSQTSGVQVAFIPDVQTLQWHHAREEFISAELLNRNPAIKGAIVEGQEERIWCVWTRSFGNTESENVLHVLRLVIESKMKYNDSIASHEGSCDSHILSTASVLSAAKREAANWNLQNVEIWNPTPITVLAARKLDPSSVIIDRDMASIPSLRWYGQNPSTVVKWALNEKYGWC